MADETEDSEGSKGAEKSADKEIATSQIQNAEGRIQKERVAAEMQARGFGQPVI